MVELVLPWQGPPPAPVKVAEEMDRPVPSELIVPVMFESVQVPSPIEVDTVASPSRSAETAPEYAAPVAEPERTVVEAAEAAGTARARAAAAAAPATARFLMRVTGYSLVLLPEGQREANSLSQGESTLVGHSYLAGMCQTVEVCFGFCHRG